MLGDCAGSTAAAPVGPLSRDAELMAVALLGGETALVSHGRQWSSSASRTSVLRASMPWSRASVSPPGIRFHRSTIHPRDRTDRRGIPVTMVHRLLVDLADVVSVPHEITAVIREAAFLGLYSLLATQDAIDRANGRRTALLRKAIELYSRLGGTKSGEEVKTVALFNAKGLPCPLVNSKLLGEEVDSHWPSLNLVIELDGSGHGRTPVRRDDVRRDHVLREAGWDLYRVREPEDVVALYRSGTS